MYIFVSPIHEILILLHLLIQSDKKQLTLAAVKHIYRHGIAVFYTVELYGNQKGI